MSLADAAQQATRRLTVLQSREAIHRKIAHVIEDREQKRLIRPVKLDVRAHPEADPFDLVFYYHRTIRRGQNLIVTGRSTTRERVRVYVPSNPEEAVEAVLH